MGGWLLGAMVGSLGLGWRGEVVSELEDVTDMLTFELDHGVCVGVCQAGNAAK